MPRFGLNDSPPAARGSPGPSYTNNNFISPPAAAAATATSRGSTRRHEQSQMTVHSSQSKPAVVQQQPLLSCLSPDGRSVHILHGSSIETHALPLAGTSEADADISARVPIISTPLPSMIGNSDSIVEFVCIEGDAMPEPETSSTGTTMMMLPLLCLYTCHAVYSLKIGYPDTEDTEQGQILGIVLECTQPFESKLDMHQQRIVRVRPAPHRRLGYATFCPRGSLAALVGNLYDDGSQEYSLLVYHSHSKTVTEPLTYRTEAVLENDDICDFCFAQSNAQALLVTLSVHIIKTNGNVMGASPILFDGSMVPRAFYEEACNLLEDYSTDADTSEAKSRQCIAATHFLQEAFEPVQGGGGGPDSYMQARLHNGNPNTSTLWPAQWQGPVIHGTASASSAEPYFCRNLCGLAVVGAGGIQISVVAPTSVMPRFAFASVEDQVHLHHEQVPGVLVECIPDLAGTRLVRDPVLDTMLHVISERGVTTLTSEALRQASASIQGKPMKYAKPTKAWMAVDLAQQVQVQGAVVSGDAHLGHVMIVYLSTGQLTAINLTETRVRYEASALAPQLQIQQQQQPKDEALQNMEATLAFHEQLGPVVEKIEAGLLGMQKIVGTSTHPKDIDAGILAAALSVKSHCEHNVIVHLKYLAKIKALRMSELKKVLKGQQVQLQSIQESLSAVKSENKKVRANMEALEKRSKHLAVRSSTLLQASKDLRPVLTKADVHYFETLQRVQEQCSAWEEHVRQLQFAAETLATQTQVVPTLTPLEAADVRTLLRGQKDMIDQTQDRIESTQSLVSELVRETPGVFSSSDEDENYYGQGQ
jgi:hypothetical protein